MIGRRGFMTGLVSFAAVLRTSSDLTPPAAYDVFSFGKQSCNPSLWLVSWEEDGTYPISPTNVRYERLK